MHNVSWRVNFEFNHAYMFTPDHTLLAMVNIGTIAISDQEPSPSGHVTNNCNAESCKGRLWIYFSDSRRTRRWGTLRNGNSFISEERDIACKQLGYRSSSGLTPSEPPPLNDPAGVPVWLTNFKCHLENDRKDLVNLLQCKPELCTEETCPRSAHQSEDVVLDCGGFSICLADCYI